MRIVQEETKFIPIWEIYLSSAPTFISLPGKCTDFWLSSLFLSSSGGLRRQARNIIRPEGSWKEEVGGPVHCTVIWILVTLLILRTSIQSLSTRLRGLSRVMVILVNGSLLLAC